MGSAGDGTEDLILDAMIGDGRAANMPDTLYFALYTVAPTDSGGGTEVGTSGTAYDRVAIDSDDINWNAASGGQKTNAVDIEWATATDDWGTLVAWAAHETATPGVGEPFVWGLLATATPILNGDTARFPASNLVINAD